jgi:hypothetical protein
MVGHGTKRGSERGTSRKPDPFELGWQSGLCARRAGCGGWVARALVIAYTTPSGTLRTNLVQVGVWIEVTNRTEWYVRFDGPSFS